MKKLLCLLGGALLLSNVQAQKVKPLNISDTVPDIDFEHVINYPVTRFKLSDFKGKLIILDFFGTWCGSCIPVVPRLDSLQKQFPDKLKVIILCQDVSIEKVKTFIAQRWKDKDIALPFVLSDSLHNGMFPHTMIPHEVWISPDRTVKAITSDQPVTAANIRAVLNNQPADLPAKTDLLNFHKEQPLFVNGNGGDENNIRFRSTFTTYLNGAPGGAGIITDSLRGTRRYYFLNRSIPSLYELVMNINPNRLVLETSDSGRFILPLSLAQTSYSWYAKNAYCYELTVPDTTSGLTARQIMLSDLNKYLGIDGRIEKRQTACWVLVRAKGKRPATDKDIPAQTIKTTGKENSDRKFKISNKPPAVLAEMLSTPAMPLVLDETGITGNISVAIRYEALNNYTELRKELQSYGMDILPAKRMIERLVITAKSTGSIMAFTNKNDPCK